MHRALIQLDIQQAIVGGISAALAIVMDKQERDKILLGAAAVALTAALGLTCLRRSVAD